MKKRVLAAFLWFYSGWYAGAILAEFLGITPMIGPIIGAAGAMIFAGDPRHVIWGSRTPNHEPSVNVEIIQDLA